MNALAHGSSSPLTEQPTASQSFSPLAWVQRLPPVHRRVAFAYRLVKQFIGRTKESIKLRRLDCETITTSIIFSDKAIEFMCLMRQRIDNGVIAAQNDGVDAYS